MARDRIHPLAAATLVSATVLLNACAPSTPTATPTTTPATTTVAATTPVGSDEPTTSAGAAAGSVPPRPPSTRGASVARPQVRGPITGGSHGSPFGAMPTALAEQHGYVEEEFFLTGEATAYTETGTWGTDGAWPVAPTTKAPFTTRILVRRPADPTRFDGTAVVEWLNVTSGQDSDVIFSHTHDELLSHGTVWVGVSAQPVGIVGIQGGGRAMAVPGVEAMPLKTWDPDRYAPLAHPGDDFSYDIFSQAAAALLRPDGVDPLGGGRLASLLAGGESQSAARMVTYVNAVHPVADVYDGFLVHSRSLGGSILRTGTTVTLPFARIRTDLDDPVLQFETESDIFGLPFIAARQPDTERIRTWEVAGTAHLDQGMLDYFRSAAAPAPSPGSSPGSTAGSTADPLTELCGQVNAGPQSAVLSKALASLRTWVVDGTPPAASPLIEVRGDAIARDERGIALGGIRTPAVDAPIAALRGDNASGGGYICQLFGSTSPFDAATLAALYPTHQDYVDAVTRSATAAVAKGHLLERDADAFVEAAARSPIGG